MTTRPPTQLDFSRQLQNPMLLQAAMAMNDNRLHDAEPLLRQHLKADPFDVAVGADNGRARFTDQVLNVATFERHHIPTRRSNRRG